MKLFKVVGAINDPELFYGRGQLLKELERNIEANNYALVGLRRTGKTSILNMLERKLDKNYLVARLDLSSMAGISDPEVFSKQFSLALTKAYFKKKRTRKLLNQFENFLKEKFGGMVAFTKAVHISVADFVEVWFEYSQSREKDPIQLIEKTLQYPDKLSRAVKKDLVVFIDEFQFIEGLPENILWTIRSGIQKSKKTHFIISGSAPSLLSRMIWDKSLPFYGEFIRKDIRGIDERSSLALIKRLNVFGITLSDGLIMEILRRTERYPLYLQGFGLATYDYSVDGGKKSFDLADFDILWDEFFEKLRFHFHEYAEDLSANEKQVAYTLVKYDTRTAMEISHKIGKPAGQIRSYLNRLVLKDILEKREAKYYFTDEIFEEYVRRNFECSEFF